MKSNEFVAHLFGYSTTPIARGLSFKVSENDRISFVYAYALEMRGQEARMREDARTTGIDRGAGRKVYLTVRDVLTIKLQVVT